MIGTGGMGTAAHLTAYHDSPFSMIAALCDVSPSNLAAASARFGVSATFTDYREMLAQTTLDLVDVSTPNNVHAEISIAALKKGIPVICEKPLAMNRHESREMLSVARRENLPTAVNFSYRYVPAARHIREIIQSGEIGEIYHVIATYNQGWLSDPASPHAWRLDKRLAGTGVLGDLGSHLIDLARFWGCEFRTVSGQLTTFVPERPLPGGAGRAPVDVDDAASFMVEFTNGATGSFFCTRNAFARANTQRAEIYGTKGGVVYDNERPNEIQFAMGSYMASQRQYGTMPVPAGLVASRSTTMHEFVKDLATGTATVATFEDGEACQEVLDAVALSAETRSWVKVPIED
jgi:predicted dehydrogenase